MSAFPKTNEKILTAFLNYDHKLFIPSPHGWGGPTAVMELTIDEKIKTEEVLELIHKKFRIQNWKILTKEDVVKAGISVN